MNWWLLQLVPEIACGWATWNWIMGIAYPEIYEPIRVPDVYDVPMTIDSEHRGLI